MSDEASTTTTPAATKPVPATVPAAPQNPKRAKSSEGFRGNIEKSKPAK